MEKLSKSKKDVSPSTPGGTNENLRKFDPWLKKLGIYGVDEENIRMVFTHTSYRQVNPSLESNKRLAFLGDVVIALIISENLFRSCCGSNGAMTEKRKKLVKNTFLAQLYEKQVLGRFLISALKHPPSVWSKATVVEALFGAVYLDLGYPACQKLWKRISC